MRRSRTMQLQPNGILRCIAPFFLGQFQLVADVCSARNVRPAVAPLCTAARKVLLNQRYTNLNLNDVQTSALTPSPSAGSLPAPGRGWDCLSPQMSGDRTCSGVALRLARRKRDAAQAGPTAFRDRGWPVAMGNSWGGWRFAPAEPKALSPSEWRKNHAEYRSFGPCGSDARPRGCSSGERRLGVHGACVRLRLACLGEEDFETGLCGKVQEVREPEVA